jgi:hypothetical protein
MRNRTCVFCGFAAILLLSSIGFSQANVNESLETAFIYVNGATGSDSNSGSQSSPLQTIGAAASMANTNNYNSIGSRIIIEPGTYRESIALNYNSRNTTLPVTFEAATKGTVIVSGSMLYTGWVKYASNPKIYTNSWLNSWGTCPQVGVGCPYQQEIMMRQELLAVNGTLMTQVLTLGQMVQGTFYVDEAAAMIYVWPPAGTIMSTATIEAATSPVIFQIQNASNIVVRGLTFQYANSCRSRAAVQVRGTSTNILFDSDTFQWNNAQGLNITAPTTYYTVENSTAQHNGDSGFQEEQVLYGLWQADTASYNNWRGAQAGYYACNTAGYHVSLSHNDTVNGMTTTFNETWGVHWDTDNANTTATAVNATGNFLAGVFMEKDEGPISVNKSYVCNQNTAGNAGGFVLRNSEDISITNSVIINNMPSQILVIGQAGGIEVTNWQTGVTTNLVSQNFTNTSNVIQANTSTQLLLDDSYLDDADWTSFQTTLNSNHNTWWNANNSTTPYIVPSPKTHTKDSFSGWQGVTLADANSSFKAPAGNPAQACTLSPVGTDYWFTINTDLMTVSPGGSATYTLALTPINFTGKVNLTMDGISEVPGLSATLSSTSLSGTTTATLTVTAGAQTAPGTYSITIIANSGSITRTVTTQLNVQ